MFKILTKVIYEYNYKDWDHFADAITRWKRKGWIMADEINHLDPHSTARDHFLIMFKKIEKRGS